MEEYLVLWRLFSNKGPLVRARKCYEGEDSIARPRVGEKIFFGGLLLSTTKKVTSVPNGFHILTKHSQYRLCIMPVDQLTALLRQEKLGFAKINKDNFFCFGNP